MKVANIGRHKCPHFSRLRLIMQTGAETRIVVVVVVVMLVVVLVIPLLISCVLAGV